MLLKLLILLHTFQCCTVSPNMKLFKTSDFSGYSHSRHGITVTIGTNSRGTSLWPEVCTRAVDHSAKLCSQAGLKVLMRTFRVKPLN